MLAGRKVALAAGLPLLAPALLQLICRSVLLMCSSAFAPQQRNTVVISRCLATGEEWCSGITSTEASRRKSPLFVPYPMLRHFCPLDFLLLVLLVPQCTLPIIAEFTQASSSKAMFVHSAITHDIVIKVYTWVLLCARVRRRAPRVVFFMLWGFV